MKVTITEEDNGYNIIYCDYIRAHGKMMYFYSNEWLAHYIAIYDMDKKEVKIYSPKECVDSYRRVKNVKWVSIFED